MKAPHQATIQYRTEKQLFLLSITFLFLYSLILTFSPAARERSWDVELHWSHWLGYLAWVITFSVLRHQLRRQLPDSDPFVLPVSALLVGWGLLTIWRLYPFYGFRQSLWLLLGGVIIYITLQLKPNLTLLRRYKYLLFSAGLILTTLTLFFGINPLGGESRLWLGGYGIYFQPSEPLKLLLIIYLAAYFAGAIPLKMRSIVLIAPTVVVTAVTLLLLIFQRDLGTASIFIFLYTVMVYFATGKRRFLLVNLGILLLAGLAGYLLYDVVQLRVDAWLNPWNDPSGRSYQIVQALLAVSSGGLLGRGPGLGNPGLVPVSLSDFIFTAIAEETGLVGTIGLLLLIGIFLARGFLIAIHAQDRFHRLLAAGLTSYLGAQSLLIIGGNVRLLPLTGVTLPLVSYGGSSLTTSLLSILFLMIISDREKETVPLRDPKPYLVVPIALGLGIIAAAITTGWWAIVRGPSLLTRTDNARRSIADRYVMRGSLLDRNGAVIYHTEGSSGTFVRHYDYVDFSPIGGYTNPNYGQAGLEASLDSYLRGLQGNPASLIWLDHLYYGQPPPGLNVRLSIDLGRQEKADSLLGAHAGAIILMNAQSGEILVMASHPTYDPMFLDENAAILIEDEFSPLVNRAAQGMYPVGGLGDLLFQAFGNEEPRSEMDNTDKYNALGFYQAPQLRLPVSEPVPYGTTLYISPIQLILPVAALCNDGILPAPRLAVAVETPLQSWVILPALTEPIELFPADGISNVTSSLLIPGQPLWQYVSSSGEKGNYYTWYIGGTVPDWQGTPMSVVVLLEEENQLLAQSIGQAILRSSIR